MDMVEIQRSCLLTIFFLESDGAEIQTNHILMIYFVPTHRPRSEQNDKECFAANDHIWNIW